MNKTLAGSVAAIITLILSSLSTAHAQDMAADAPEALTLTGSAALASQYRFRGISLSDEELAIQGSINLNHFSGFYVGTWASSLAGFGSFGGSNVELDVYGGYKTSIGDATVDIGLLWYLYPGTDETDYTEIYASIGGAFGPASAKLGVNYAPDQQAIGDSGNIYIYGDVLGGIPNTPVTLKAHLGYSDGSSTLAPTGEYLDWLVGADLTWKNLTLGVAYVDTDIKDEGAFFSVGDKDIVDSAVVVSLTASF